MFENKYQIARNFMLLCMLILFVAGSKIPNSLAAPANTITLDATQDTYTDINADTTNFDEALLTAANSPGFLENSDVTTKQIFLEFDLSSVDFEIKSATLSLATLTCGGKLPVDVVDMAVLGVENDSSWDESTLTWQNQPDISTDVLITMDSGGTNFNRARVYTWTDDSQGDFATWLETQRNANDKSATLVLLIENSQGPGLADIFFGDSEGSAASYGCAAALSSPNLQVSDRVAGFEIFLPFTKR